MWIPCTFPWHSDSQRLETQLKTFGGVLGDSRGNAETRQSCTTPTNEGANPIKLSRLPISAAGENMAQSCGYMFAELLWTAWTLVA